MNTIVLMLTLLISMNDFRPHAPSANATFGSAEFSRVDLGWPSKYICNYEGSPIDFCDVRFMGAYSTALKLEKANFAQHYILLPISYHLEYSRIALVALDTRTGVAYPMPFDSFVPSDSTKLHRNFEKTVDYNLDSNRVCLVGDLVAHRITHSRRACFVFDGNRFAGYDTPYTSAGEWQMD